MEVLIAVPAGFAVLGWLLAFASAIELSTRHRREDRSTSWYWVRGISFLDPDNFAPSGEAAHRRMLMGFGGFFLGVGGTFLVALLTNPPAS